MGTRVGAKGFRGARGNGSGGGGGGEEPGVLLPPKFAALQHGNSTWLTTSSDTRRNIIADHHEMVMCGMTVGLSGIPARLDYLRTRRAAQVPDNPGLIITQYTQVWETRGKGVLGVQFVSGTTYRFTLDSTTEGASSSGTYGTVGQQMYLRNFATAAFNSNFTVTRVHSTDGIGGRACFEVSIPSLPAINAADVSGSKGTCLNNSTDGAHLTRYLLCAESGPPEGMFLRGDAGGFQHRLRSSGVDPSQRAVNFTRAMTPESPGQWWPQIKAAFDKANLFDPYQPTIGDPLIAWVDNWNVKQRNSGYWGATEGGPVGTTVYSSTDTGVASRSRQATADYAAALRAEMPGIKVLGNADGVTGAAPAGIQSLTGWAEWPVNTLDGCFIEEIYGCDSTGAEDLNKIGAAFNDNWTKLQGRLRDQRSMIAQKHLHVIQVQGRGTPGSNRITQQADHQFFMVGLGAWAMLGNTRAEMSHYCFGPVEHDVSTSASTQDFVPFVERTHPLGEPIEPEQTAARGGTWPTTAWARAFQGGAIVANASTTVTITITASHLATLNHPPGTAYKHLTDPAGYGPLNTGAGVTSFNLPPKTAVMLARQ